MNNENEKVLRVFFIRKLVVDPVTKHVRNTKKFQDFPPDTDLQKAKEIIYDRYGYPGNMKPRVVGHKKQTKKAKASGQPPDPIYETGWSEVRGHTICNPNNERVVFPSTKATEQCLYDGAVMMKCQGGTTLGKGRVTLV